MRDMYPSTGPLLQRSLRSAPFLPMNGKRGRRETSKPVAHTIASASYSFPSFVTTPFSVIRSIGFDTTVTWSSHSDSRKPLPGVRRRQPTANLGVRILASSGFLASLAAIVSADILRAAIWSGLSLRYIV